MNILHVVNIYFVLPFFFGNQFIYFRHKGHKMFVACSPSEYLLDYSKLQGVDYIETPVKRSLSPKEDLISIKKICSYIRENKIDVVVGHTPKGGLISMLSSWICRVPKRIYFRHGIVYETSHGIKRLVLKTIDKITSLCATEIICVSPSVLKRSIEDNLAPAYKQRIILNGTCNGIDTITQFNPASIDLKKLTDLRNRYNIDINDFIIGYSGRLVRDKGIIELIQAFDKLRNADNCKLLLVGMFEDRDALPNNIKERIEKDSRIIYTGFINGGMEYFYSLMDIYILPSYREGFPTGVLEAQAMEKPVITTRVTGCCDSIIDGKTGLFANNTPDDIACKIDQIRFDNAIDGKQGRKWVQDNFESRLIWSELEKIYTK